MVEGVGIPENGAYSGSATPDEKQTTGGVRPGAQGRRDAPRISATVSVVVPSYNRAGCLRETVASVLAQTVQPSEVIVVDDGSTDDTPAVCRGFSAPVRYLRRSNGGCAAARNTGIRAATGEFIALLDADDIWEPTKLEVQLALHAAYPEIGWSTTNHLTTDLANQPLSGVQGFARDLPAFQVAGRSPDAFFAPSLSPSELVVAGQHHRAYTGDAFELLFYGNFILPSAALLHRRVVERVGSFDEDFRCAEETEFFHRVSATALLGVVTTPLVRWRRGRPDTLVSGQNAEELIRNALVSLDRAAALRDPTPPARRACTAGRRHLMRKLAYTQLSNLDPEAARSTIRRAWAEGLGLSAPAVGLYAASLLPRRVLQGLGTVKRRLS
jgi:GT2 family glycosyltransferase